MENIAAVEQTPAPETPVSDASVDLGDVYDQLMSDAPEPPEPEQAEAPEVEEQPAEVGEVEAPEVEQAEAPDFPRELPNTLKGQWANIPQAAREAIEASHKEMTTKLSTQGRMMHGIAPVRDALVEAAKENPSLANMRPEQVAKEIMELSRISHQFNEKPAETIVGLIEKHGLEQAIGQALQGQSPTQEARETAALKQEIAGLKRQVAQFSDPSFMESQFTQYSQQAVNQQAVEQFASTAEHWSKVESHLAMVIPVVQARLGESASPQDVLSAAYELAVSQFVPDAQKAPPAVAPLATPDPERTQAARNAKSINTRSNGTGKPRKLTQREALSEAYDRAMKD